MNNERWDRYKPQLMAIAENLDEMHIAYHKGHDPDENPNNVYFHGFLKDISKKGKFPFSLIPLRRAIGFIRINRFAKFVSKIDGDLIYCLSTGGYPQTGHLLLRRLIKKPTIYRMRGYGVKERRYIYNSIDSKLINFLDVQTSRRYDYHIPICEEYRKILLNRNINSIRISKPIFNGVDTRMFKPINQPNELVIGYLGRISPEKGITFLNELMYKTRNVKYLFAGNIRVKWYKPENCEYVGPLKHKDVPDFINRCSLLVLPSYSEGISNVILEAYSCGRVLITSKQAIKEEVKNFGWSLNHNLGEWVKLIGNLNLEDLKQRGLRARKWVEKLSWDIYGKRMVREFMKVIKKGVKIT